MEFIVLALSAEKRRIGDKTAGTIVVNNPYKPTKLPRILTLAGIGVVVFGFVMVFTAVAMKNSEAYQTAVQKIEQNKDILSETGGIEGYGMMPSGSINTSNGSGKARLHIKVVGKEKNVQVRVSLRKEKGGMWQVIDMRN